MNRVISAGFRLSSRAMSDVKSPLTADFPKPEVIAQDIAKDGFAIYDGALDVGAVEEMKHFWADHFRNTRPRRRVLRGELRLGEENFTGYTDDKQNCLFRDIDFLWNRPSHALTRKLGEDVHRVRNLAQKFDADLGFGYRDDCYGIYVSTSCYPTGNGWMAGHTDGHKDKPILQYMACFSHKGIDYEGGGLYLVDKGGSKVDVDRRMRPGSIVFFDGRLKHGVDTIGKSLGAPGRIASFAITTFFRTRKELPDLMRRAEDTWWRVERRIEWLKGLAGQSKPQSNGAGGY